MSKLPMNKNPYFNDFSSEKNFMRVLFQPGRPVQTRELNQLQSILGHQIESFANHIFKNGSRVSNAQAGLKAQSYIRLEDFKYYKENVPDAIYEKTNEYVDLSIYKAGMLIVGETSTIRARLVKAINKENDDPPTIYIVYLSTGIDSETIKFIPGEILEFHDENDEVVYSVRIKCPGCENENDLDNIEPLGNGSIFTINEGIFYFEGFFIENKHQDIVVSKYGEIVDCKLGFDFIQTIITNEEDETLLDNALGYPNNSAPGADRYKIELILTKRSLNNEDGENYILLAKVENGVYTYLKEDTQYANIMDMIAKRTYEINGNFTVNPFRLRFIEDKAISIDDPHGYDIEGDENYVRAVVSNGISYVNGYRFENTSDQYIPMQKARDTKKISGFTKYFEERSYFFLQPLKSYSVYPNDPNIPSNVDNTIIQVYDGPFTVSKIPSGTLIATFKIYDVKGTSIGTINAGGVISSIIIVNGGQNYTSAPTIVFEGGGGTNASAQAIITNGKVVSIIVSNGGQNYEYPPTITFNGGGGSGAVAKATISGPAVFKYYFYDLKILEEGRKLSEGQSFIDSGSTNNFKAIPWTDNVKIYNPGNTELLWQIERDDIKSLRSIDDDENPDPPGSISIFLRRKLSGTLDSNGTRTFNSYTNEYFEPYNATSTICVIEKDQIFYTVDLGINNRFNRTPISITINLGASLDVGTGTDISTSGATLTIIHNVLRTNASEDKKTKSETIESINIIPTLNEIGLGITDAFSIMYVYQYDPADDPITLHEVDITEQFQLINGIKDFAYNESKIVFKGTEINPLLRWRFKINYYEHDNTNNLGYYTIDSYKELIESGKLEYDSDLKHISNNKTEYHLFNCFDFRPNIINNVISGNSIPVIGSTAIFDIEYYLKRIDLLCVNKDSDLYIKKGIPAETPLIPTLDDYAMALYEIHLQPYTYSLEDIKIKYIENKRYTMRDIGGISNRLKSLEYYTLLNLLESNVQNSSIKDKDGFDRFKNGFVTDNFQDYNAADLTNTEFRAALDRKTRQLRPSFTARNKKLSIKGLPTNAIFKGKMAMIDYNDHIIDEQPFATKHISINPYFQFKKMGEMVLSPNNDTWSDTERQPDLVVNVDTGTDAVSRIANEIGLLGTTWGNWSDLNRSIDSTNITTDVEGGGVMFRNTQTSNLTSRRRGINRTIESRTDSYNLGDRITDINIIPFMRATTIQFYATKLKPLTKVWAFFDKKPVSQYCRTFQGLNTDQLMTDANGQIAGIFECPPGQFFTGDRIFYITSDKDLTGDPDLETTAAEALFFSGGMDITKQSTTMNVMTPDIREEAITQNRTITSIRTTTTIRCPEGTTWNGTECEQQNPPRQACMRCGFCPGCTDPIAQSFKLEKDHFITGLDIYFQQIDTLTDEIFVQIRNMNNGYPGKTILSDKRILTPNLIASDDSSVPYHVKFNFPIFVQGNVEYCFVIGGFSPDTRVWVAKVGDTVVNIPNKIVETQPSIGSSFRSQNAETWNAEQYEDIKYRLYVAKFKRKELNLSMEHIPERIKLQRNPFESQTGSNLIRVSIKDHGFNANDNITLSLTESDWVEIGIDEGQMRIGMLLSTTVNNFQGIVTAYRTDQIKTEVQFQEITGEYDKNEPFVCADFDLFIHDLYMFEQIGYHAADVSNDGRVRYNRVEGKILSDPPIKLNGIPIKELNKTHTILSVDSIDSIIIQVETPAITSGSFGGEEIYSHINEKFEVFNVSGAYMGYGSEETFKFKGIAHNPINGSFIDYQQLPIRQFRLGEDNHLSQPYKIISKDNYAAGRKVNISLSFVSKNEWISPMVNTDSFSITTISNRIEWVTKEQLNVIPNASGRFLSESDPMNGSEKYKYITKVINLKNPADDLMIAFEVYKPIEADYDVWVKILSPYEENNIDDKRWMRIIGYDKTHHSSDLDDKIEVELTLSELQVEVYSNNETFVVKNWYDLENDQFSSFRIKIIGKSKNPSLPPLFENFRAIALT